MSIPGVLIAVAILASALVANSGRRGWLGWVAGLAPLIALPVRIFVEATTVVRIAMDNVVAIESTGLLFGAIPIGILALATQRISGSRESGDSLRIRAGLQLGLAGLVYGSGLESILFGNVGLLVFTALAFVGVIALPELLLGLSDRKRVSA